MESRRKQYWTAVSIMALFALAFCALTGVGVTTAYGQTEGVEVARQVAGGAAESLTESTPPLRWDLCFGMAISIAIPCLAAGYAVGKVGAAALGAASERPELLARSLVFVALGEGLAIFGFLVSLLLWLKF